jgi:hypothetical protein
MQKSAALSFHRSLRLPSRISFRNKSRPSSLSFNAELLDERPPFVDSSLLQRAQSFRALLVDWNNLLPEIDQSRSRRGIRQSIYNRSVKLVDDVFRCALRGDDCVRAKDYLARR